MCSHGRQLRCGARHRFSDEQVGTPLCPDFHDYVGAVLQNASTPELWRRTTIYVQRRLAVVLGCTQTEAARVVRLASCRVAEFQRRGLVYLHAVVRADGNDGKATPIDCWQLARACADAAREVRVSHPHGVARWGHEIDVQVLVNDHVDRSQRVATYVAGYSTKSSSEHPGLQHRILSQIDLDRRTLPPHLHRMVATAWTLGDEPELQHLGLRRHAHRLGYGGHFLSKSRTYSTTFSALRQARVLWQEDRRTGGAASTRGLSEGRWRAVGSGWANQGEELLAGYQQRQQAEDKREAEFWWYSRSE